MFTASNNADLKAIYIAFCSFGKGNEQIAMDGRTFRKILQDSKIESLIWRTAKAGISSTTIDLVFAKIMAKGKRKIGFLTFCKGLEEIAKRGKTTVDALVKKIIAKGGPTARGTKSDNQRRSDFPNPQMTSKKLVCHTGYTVTEDTPPTQKCAPANDCRAWAVTGKSGADIPTFLQGRTSDAPTEKCAEAPFNGYMFTHTPAALAITAVRAGLAVVPEYHKPYVVTSDAPPTQKCAEAPTRASDDPQTRKPAGSPSQKVAGPGSNSTMIFAAGCLIGGLIVTMLKSRK